VWRLPLEEAIRNLVLEAGSEYEMNSAVAWKNPISAWYRLEKEILSLLFLQILNDVVLSGLQ
jgi:hypothetical protein